MIGIQSEKKKKTLDDYLDNIDYDALDKYVPSVFALKFLNFIKQVNGARGESNKTPPFHLFMLDKLGSKSERVVNLCFRGSGKTSVYAEYMFFYIPIFHHLPYLGNVDVALYIADSMENGAKNLRRNMEHRYNNSEFLQRYLPEVKFTDTTIDFKNAKSEPFSLKLYGASTGFRGTKAFGKRPNLVILDDIIPDEAGKSKTLMDNIKDMLYNAVIPALDPTKKKIILNGTPFSKNDVIVEAVESGTWDVNVFPVCEKFPCDKKDFRGAWEDRFSYEYVKDQYEVYCSVGKPQGFFQEYMLRINSAEERLVQDSEILWYSRMELLKNRQNFNFYITTDFATSAKQTADWSVISVWAYNNNGDWFWVDGMCEKQTMDLNIEELFSLVQLYEPKSVGIEVTGQQGAFINWLQKEMLSRNIFFSFAKSGKNNTSIGIRPDTDKLTRFNLVVPYFKMGKMYFPEELKTSNIMGECMSELKLATRNGIKGHDDFIDTISMLAYMHPWKPSIVMTPRNTRDTKHFGFDDSMFDDTSSEMDSYIV